MEAVFAHLWEGGGALVRAEDGAAVRDQGIAGGVIWNRLGAFLCGTANRCITSGDSGVKKFDPVWEPHCLYPGDEAAHILADISALVAGGYRRMFL